MKTIQGKTKFGIIPLFKSKFMGIDSMRWDMTREECEQIDTARSIGQRFTLSEITDNESQIFIDIKDRLGLSSKEQLVLLLKTNGYFITDDKLEENIKADIVADDYFIITL